MNLFTERSIELANQRDYLDQLFRVYPLAPDTLRDIDETVWENIKSHFNSGENDKLISDLLDLDLFPIKDGYVPYLRRDRTAINRNPMTCNRICGRVRELGLEKLYEKCTQPKETNRQMGPLFRNYVNSGVLGVKPVDEYQFDLQNKGIAILSGSDAYLKQYAQRKLGYLRDKGIDLIAKVDGTFIVGEAKFISDEGGHQNDQFLDAMTTLNEKTHDNVINIAILDGVLYIPGKKKMYSTITKDNLPVMSALLLRDYLYSFIK